MSLRARLALAFVLVVLGPLATAAVLLGRAVPGELTDRVAQQLGSSLNAVVAAARVACQEVELASLETGGSVARGEAARVLARLGQRGVPVAVVFPATGGAPRIFGSLPGLDGAGAAAVLRDAPDCAGGLGERYVVGRQETAAGTVVSALPLAPELLARLRDSARSRGRADPDVTLVSRPNRMLATSVRGGPGGVDAAEVQRAALAALAAQRGEARAAGQVIALAPVDGRGPVVVAVSLRPRDSSRLQLLLAVVVLAAAGVAALLGVQLARLVTRPLVQLGDAAKRVTEGDLETEIPVERRGNDEIATLAVAFNRMTRELRSTIHDLQSSRDELRRNLTRLGDTLSSTHDLTRILEVILETAMTSVRAEAGVLLLRGGPDDVLHVRSARGLDERLPAAAGADGRTFTIAPGVGVLGRAFVGGDVVRGVIGAAGGGGGDSGEAPERDTSELVCPAPGEPLARTVLAAGLRTSGRSTGVIGLYDRSDGLPFDEADAETISTFAAQAAVAVDNVILHQEAQRLSVTDALTGLGNYRYLSLALSREVERAARFGRPLAVLMLDLDRFKGVNDVHGHQRGDEVLVEVAARLRAVIREVDVVARYGGEEMVLVLPETDREGAELLADRVGEVMRQQPFGGPEQDPVRVTVSTGIAVRPEHGVTGAALLRAADEALYDAKRAGRDRWRVAGAIRRLDGGDSGVGGGPPAGHG